jgi:hypothetical protein
MNMNVFFFQPEFGGIFCLFNGGWYHNSPLDSPACYFFLQRPHAKSLTLPAGAAGCVFAHHNNANQPNF